MRNGLTAPLDAATAQDILGFCLHANRMLARYITNHKDIARNSVAPGHSCLIQNFRPDQSRHLHRDSGCQKQGSV